MSVVAITISKRKISIASDSITASGWTTTTDSLAKLQQVNDIIIGSAGRSQCASLLFLYACNHSPVENTTRGILEWVSEFVSWVRSKYILYPGKYDGVERKRLVLQYGTLGAGTLTEAREKAVKWMEREKTIEVVEIRQCKPNKFVAVERKQTPLPPVLR